jgi:copper homeostasis protein
MIFPLEICLAADDLKQLKLNTQAVMAGGVQRIELCSNMAQEGLTPSVDAIRLVKNIVGESIELLVMLRPTAGDFCYSAAQIKHMLATMTELAQAGANGVVTGVLDSQQQVDYQALKQLLKQAKRLGLSLTFHRAFDAVHEQQQALQYFIQFGVRRVLTSGTAWMSGQGAEQGVVQLHKFMEQVADKLEIVVGGGVNLNNISVLKQQLAGGKTKVSFHVHSAVLNANQIDRAKLATLASCLVSDMTD